jgi:hypothetical protein
MEALIDSFRGGHYPRFTMKLAPNEAALFFNQLSILSHDVGANAQLNLVFSASCLKI